MTNSADTLPTVPAEYQPRHLRDDLSIALAVAYLEHQTSADYWGVTECHIGKYDPATGTFSATFTDRNEPATLQIASTPAQSARIWIYTNAHGALRYGWQLTGELTPYAGRWAKITEWNIDNPPVMAWPTQ